MVYYQNEYCHVCEKRTRWSHSDMGPRRDPRCQECGCTVWNVDEGRRKKAQLARAVETAKLLEQVDFTVELPRSGCRKKKT